MERTNQERYLTVGGQWTTDYTKGQAYQKAKVELAFREGQLKNAAFYYGKASEALATIKAEALAKLASLSEAELAFRAKEGRTAYLAKLAEAEAVAKVRKAEATQQRRDKAYDKAKAKASKRGQAGQGRKRVTDF